MLSFFKAARPIKFRDEPEPGALRFRVAPEVKASQHADGVVLIHVRKGTVFSANRVGAIIWNGAAERWSMERVAASISAEFNIPPQIVQKDAADFLAQLEAEGLLVADVN